MNRPIKTDVGQAGEAAAVQPEVAPVAAAPAGTDLGTDSYLGIGEIERYSSKLDFDRACQQSEATLANRYRFELALAALAGTSSLLIDCSICRKQSRLVLHGGPETDPDWRERGICSHCELNCRTRLGLRLIDEGLDPYIESVYLCEQTTPCFAWARRLFAHVSGSEFCPDAERRTILTEYLRGTLNDPHIELDHQDLTALDYSSNSFSRIGCFEVLEHVPDYHSALREMYRVMRVGGRVVISVPFRHDLSSTLVRAVIGDDDGVQHLMPAEYHGDPVGDGVLCFYHFGWDLLDAMRDVGFSDVEYVRHWSPSAGLLGLGGLIVANK